MDRLKGKTALITGAASGIGLATAQRFVAEGARVVLSDIAVEAGEAATRALQRRSKDVAFVRLDVGSAAEWRAALAFVIDRFGSLDILVNNAFRGIGKTIATASLEEFRDQFAITTDGTFLGMRLASEVISDGGAIVNLSSIAAIVAAPRNAAYGAAKAAVTSMTKSAAIEFARGGRRIRVNSVAPGLVRTAALEEVVKVYFATEEAEGIEKGLSAMARSVPLGHLGLPQEIANAILFLASDEASFITGAELVVDGGQTIE